MPLRPATFTDLLPASQAIAAAFVDEELFGKVLHPHRKEYPEDMYLFFLRLLRVTYYSSPDDHIILSTATSSSTAGGEEAITGVAIWTRKRASKRKPSFANQAMTKVIENYNAAEALLYPNRARDPSMADVLERTDPFTKHHWTGSRAESWYLNLLGVDPAYSGKGVGRELVQWGFVRAREEGVGCSVIAALGKERFYERCGFDVTVGKASDFGGEKNPLGFVQGGTIQFWDGGKPVEGVEGYKEV